MSILDRIRAALQRNPADDEIERLDRRAFLAGMAVTSAGLLVPAAKVFAPAPPTWTPGTPPADGYHEWLRRVHPQQAEAWLYREEHGAWTRTPACPDLIRTFEPSPAVAEALANIPPPPRVPPGRGPWGPWNPMGYS